ncbi:hypothetical protein CI610_00008 [invertebrate metagenome]|uniref:Uncharacterized protein n=1 Tax=invertebrate metagenome TaxID=1711999 RepID=A0A2H9TCH8_9ZZZZ
MEVFVMAFNKEILGVICFVIMVATLAGRIRSIVEKTGN